MRELEPAPTIIIGSNDPYKLRELLHREHGRRAIIVRSPMTEVTPGLWQVQVVQLRPLQRRWVMPAAVAGAVVAVGALSWVLVSAAVSVLAGIGLTSLAGFGALCLGAWLLARPHGGCSIDVHVRHRH